MIERLDKKIRANILAVTDDHVLLDAFWPASERDKKNFFIMPNGLARNTVVVSREYFERRYGVEPCLTN